MFALKSDGFDHSAAVCSMMQPMSQDASPHLTAAGAAWDDGPEAGLWIADRLGPFGTSVGHAVPRGYAAYAVAPLWPEEDLQADHRCLPVIEAVLDILTRFTGDQPVHCGMWEGWGWWYSRGEDPRTAPGMGAGVYWAEGDEPTQDEIDRALADARERLALDRVQRPDVAPLRLPERAYHLWTGPLRSVTAFCHQQQDPPSLIWPEDRTWFIGAPSYTNEIAIAGTTALVDAVVADPRLSASRASPDDALDIDD